MYYRYPVWVPSPTWYAVLVRIIRSTYKQQYVSIDTPHAVSPSYGYLLDNNAMPYRRTGDTCMVCCTGFVASWRSVGASAQLSVGGRRSESPCRRIDTRNEEMEKK